MGAKRPVTGAGPLRSGSTIDEVIGTTDAILAGRRWYDVATRRHDGSAGIYGGTWTGPVFVITHQPPAASDDPAVTFLSDGIGNAIATARKAANGKNVGVLGAETARHCINKGLIDEIFIHLAPVLLGDGIRLFTDQGAGRVNLEKLSVAESGQLTDLRFRIRK